MPSVPGPTSPEAGHSHRAAPSRTRRAARLAAWTAAAALLVFVVMRIFGLERGWALTAAVAFTPYAAAFGLAAAVAAAFARSRRAAATFAVCAALLGALVLPRAVPSAQPEVDGPRLQVLTVNLHVGAADLETVVDMVETADVDVLSVQELTQSASAQLDKLGLEAQLPHVLGQTGTAADGAAIYSKHRLTARPELEPEGIFHQPVAAVEVPGAAAVEFMSVHPAAPYAPHRVQLWEADLRALPAAEPDGPLRILAGDFNATHDHAALRAVVDSGYVDAAVAHGAGLRGTWSPGHGRLPGWLPVPGAALDRVLVDSRASVADVEVLPAPGGDHRPVLATLQLPAG